MMSRGGFVRYAALVLVLVAAGCGAEDRDRGLGLAVAGVQDEDFRIASHFPQYGALGVKAGAPLSFRFNRDFDWDTLHCGVNSTFHLQKVVFKDTSGKVVAPFVDANGRIDLDDPNASGAIVVNCVVGDYIQTSYTEFLYKPLQDLEPNTWYRAAFFPGIRNLSRTSPLQGSNPTRGVNPANPTKGRLQVVDEFFFKTGGGGATQLLTLEIEVAPSQREDLLAATSTRTASARTDVVATFSQALDAATVTTSSFFIQKKGGHAVPGTIAATSAGAVFTFTPHFLEQNAEYQVVVDESHIRDTGRAPIAAGAVKDFNTETVFALTSLSTDNSPSRNKLETIAVIAGPVSTEQSGNDGDDLVVLMDYQDANGTNIDYLTVYPNSGSGGSPAFGFSSATGLKVGGTASTDHLYDPEHPRLTDLDGDGWADLVMDRNNVGNLSGASGTDTDVLTVLRNTASSPHFSLSPIRTGPDTTNNLGFNVPSGLTGEQVNPKDILIGNLDGQFQMDIVVAGGSSVTVNSFLEASGGLSPTGGNLYDAGAAPLLLGRQPANPATRMGITGAAAGPMDSGRDSLYDVVFAYTDGTLGGASESLNILKNAGGGVYDAWTAQSQIVLGNGMITTDVETASWFDGGGPVDDIAVGVVENAGTAQPAPQVWIYYHNHVGGASTGNPDGTWGDGTTANALPDQRLVLPHAPSSLATASWGPARILALDWDGDGYQDMAVAMGEVGGLVDGLVVAFRWDPSTQTFEVPGVVVPGLGKKVSDMSVGDFDLDLRSQQPLRNDLAVSASKDNTIWILKR